MAGAGWSASPRKHPASRSGPGVLWMGTLPSESPVHLGLMQQEGVWRREGTWAQVSALAWSSDFCLGSWLHLPPTLRPHWLAVRGSHLGGLLGPA